MPQNVDDFTAQLKSQIESDEVIVQDIQVKYLSKEYIEELEYNSLENVFFGYRLSELDELYGDNNYYFTYENGETVVKQYDQNPDNSETFGITLNNIIGVGVVLIDLALTVIPKFAPLPQPVKALMAISAKKLTKSIKKDVAEAVGSGLADAVIEGIETNDFIGAFSSALPETVAKLGPDRITQVLGLCSMKK